MKKFTTLILILSLFIGTQAIGDVLKSSNVTENKAPVPEAVQTIIETEVLPAKEECETPQEQNPAPEEIKSALTEEFINDLRMCKPYNEKVDFDLMGINLSFKIKIAGWNNDKCSYKISGKIKSLSKDFRKSFGIKISDSEISKIEPIVQCDFNKEQLETVVEAVIEEDKRSIEQINKMLNNQEIYFPATKDLTLTEKKLVKMITEDNVCTVPNMDEIMVQFSKLEQNLK